MNEPTFLGEYFILKNNKFWIEKEANKVNWQSWVDLTIPEGWTRVSDKIVFQKPKYALQRGL